MASEVKASFKHPPSYASNSVTWGWNGPMNKDVIVRDLDSLQALGFNVVTIEAGYRMPFEYLSREWFALIKTAVEELKKRNMHAWIIDEGKYPSGFAGGKFSRERPDLRMQGLVVYDTIVRTGGHPIFRFPASAESAVAINLEDNSSMVMDIHAGELRWTPPEGKWKLIVAQSKFKTAVTRAVNNPSGGKDTTNSLCDYLNPEAVNQFIDFTHNQYKKFIGDDFGKTVLGFRGDEPDFAFIPWTPSIVYYFKERKGYDIKPWLASFFLKNMTDEQKRAKADYWDVWSTLFSEVFFGLQSAWCAHNNLEYMVHLNHDESMIGLVKSEGDFFKDFRSVQIPGIDVIWHQVWPGLVADYPKFASSAAHLSGRPRAFSESFAAMNPAPNIDQAEWILNHQFVRGINLFECMFFLSTSEGKGGAKGYMADKRFPSVMAYANRASYLLAQGKPMASIAVYFPTTSLWLGHNTSEKSGFDIAKILLESQHDFDFIDEYALTTSKVSGQKSIVTKSGQEYTTVILPSINTLSSAACERLREFARNGGSVIFAGEHPTIITDKNFLYANKSFKFDWASTMTLSELSSSMSTWPSDLVLNEPSTSLKYLHRQWKNAELYFLFNEDNTILSRKITLNGSGTVYSWDAHQGGIESIKATAAKNGSVQLTLDLKPYETKFIVIEN